MLARLAVTEDRKGKGIGRALVQDAARRIVHAADAIGIAPSDLALAQICVESIRGD